MTTAEQTEGGAIGVTPLADAGGTHAPPPHRLGGNSVICIFSIFCGYYFVFIRVLSWFLN